LPEQQIKEEKDYPLILTAEHISEILQIGKRKSYEIMDEKGFPLIRLGKIKRTSREEFFKWIRSHSTKNDPD
jgi:hypothetical protein